MHLLLLPENFSKSVDLVVSALFFGDVCIIPTETVYGLACFNKESLFFIKKRDLNKPITIVSTLDHALKEIPFEKKHLAKGLLCTGATVVINEEESFRVPQCKFVQDVLKGAGRPFYLTSANISGEITPIKFNQIDKEVVLNAKFAIQADEIPVGISSTVIDISKELPKIIRLGAQTTSLIEATIGLSPLQ